MVIGLKCSLSEYFKVDTINIRIRKVKAMQSINKLISGKSGQDGNGIEITGNQDSDPAQFRFHLVQLQGGDCNKGLVGYINTLGIQDAILETIKYLRSEHHDFMMQAMTEYKNGLVEHSEPSTLFKQDGENGFFNTVVARNNSIANSHDSVEIFHSDLPKVSFTTNPETNKKEMIVKDAERSLDNIEIKISKWQGECEQGVQGVVRLLALSSAIERAALALNLTFKGVHNEAKKAMGVSDPTVKNKDLELML